MRLVIAAAPFLASLARAQACPEIPDTGVHIGDPVPMRPEDIPEGCSDYEVLVARGTSEPNYAEGGKFGVVVGDPVVSNLTEALPGSRGYPVQYLASFNLLGVLQGARDIISRLEGQSEACPEQTFALVGYSQGASVVHRAADDIPETLYDKIKGIVTFGDPAQRFGSRNFPEELQEKVLQNCNTGDPVCDTGNCTYHHLEYIEPKWIDPTVDFLVEAFTG